MWHQPRRLVRGRAKVSGSEFESLVKVMYTDGTTADLAVDFPDWYSNKASGNAQLAVTTANWNRPPSPGFTMTTFYH